MLIAIYIRYQVTRSSDKYPLSKSRRVIPFIGDNHHLGLHLNLSSFFFSIAENDDDAYKTVEWDGLMFER